MVRREGWEASSYCDGPGEGAERPGVGVALEMAGKEEKLVGTVDIGWLMRLGVGPEWDMLYLSAV